MGQPEKISEWTQNDLQKKIRDMYQLKRDIYKNISNCITEIPQDIKVELNNGIITVKAGSKVYIPDGFEQDGTTPKFREVIIQNDLSSTTDTGTFERTFVITSGGSLFTLLTNVIYNSDFMEALNLDVDIELEISFTEMMEISLETAIKL